MGDDKAGINFAFRDTSHQFRHVCWTVLCIITEGEARSITLSVGSYRRLSLEGDNLGNPVVVDP